jgi:hypothetical protein
LDSPVRKRRITARLALGTADIAWELVNAYRTLERGV